MPTCTTTSCACSSNFKIVPEENTCTPKKLCKEYQSLCDSHISGHRCINGAGDYSCKCADGYFNYDSKTCLKSEFKDVVPFALCINRGQITLGKLDNITQQVLNATMISDFSRVHIDYNWHRNYIVFTVGDGNVYAAKLFKNEPSLIESEEIVRLRQTFTEVQTLKIDWVHDLVFLVGDKVEAFHVKKPEVSFVFGQGLVVKQPQSGTVIDPIESKLYFAIFDTVVGVNLDGSEPRVIYNATSNSSHEYVAQRFRFREWYGSPVVKGLAIDVVSRRLFVGAQQNVTVVDFDGKVIEQFVCNLNTMFGSEAVVFGEQIVKAFDNSFDGPNKHGVVSRSTRLGKTDCNRSKLVHPVLQPKGVDKCAGSECEGLCLPTTSGSQCVEMNKSYVCYATGM